MSRHYTTKSFFRQMPNTLLARYFRECNLLQDFDFPAMKEDNASALLETCVSTGINARIFRKNQLLQSMPALSN